jgi:hypothetical protein
MIPIGSLQCGIESLLSGPTSRKDDDVGGYRHDDSIVLPVALHTKDAAGVYSHSDSITFGAAALPEGGTTTAATNIDTETTSDTASVSTSSDRNTQSKKRRPSKKWWRLFPKLPRNTYTQPTGYQFGGEVSGAQSEASQGHTTVHAAAIDVAETTVKSAEEILVGNGRQFVL